MQSNTASAIRNGKVRCRMVNDDLPVDICDREQDTLECSGCTSPTRRCTACGKTRGILNAEKGWCEACVKNAGLAPRTASFEGTPDVALSTAFARVRTLGTGAPATDTSATSVREQRESLGASPAMQDPKALYPLLMEHGIERNGAWEVPMPVSVLMRRVHVLREEAHKVLATLAQSGLIKGSAPWETIVLRKTDGIEELRDRLDTPNAQPVRARRLQVVRTSAPASGLSSPPSMGTGRRQPRGIDVAVALKTLTSRARLVNNEHILRGAIPALQLAHHLSREQVMSLLQELVEAACVAQVDEWRTIRLIKTEMSPAVPAPVIAEEKGVEEPASVRTPIPSLSTFRNSGNARPRTQRVEPVRRATPVVPEPKPTVAAPSPPAAESVLQPTIPITEEKKATEEPLQTRGTSTEVQELKEVIGSLKDQIEGLKQAIETLAAKQHEAPAPPQIAGPIGPPAGWEDLEAMRRAFWMDTDVVREGLAAFKVPAQDIEGVTYYLRAAAEEKFAATLKLPICGKDGVIRGQGTMWLTEDQLPKRLGLPASLVKERLNRVRTMQARTKEGRPCTLYALADAKQRFSDILNAPVLEANIHDYEDKKGLWKSAEGVMRTLTKKPERAEIDRMHARLDATKGVRRLAVRTPKGTIRTFFATDDVQRTFMKWLSQS